MTDDVLRCDRCTKPAIAEGRCEACVAAGTHPRLYRRCAAHGGEAGVKRSLHSHKALYHPKKAASGF